MVGSSHAIAYFSKAFMKQRQIQDIVLQLLAEREREINLQSQQEEREEFEAFDEEKHKEMALKFLKEEFSKLRIIGATPTRWTSWHKCLLRLVRLKKPIELFFEKYGDSSSSVNLSLTEWALAEEVLFGASNESDKIASNH